MQSMKVRAFNLVPGAVIVYGKDPEAQIVSRVTKDNDLELAYGRFASGEPFVLDYNDEARLIGLTANWTDASEVDFGTN